MTKERNRFDALAEELEAAEPKVEKPRTTVATAIRVRLDEAEKKIWKPGQPRFPAPVQRVRSSREVEEEPGAYISVMGRLYTVLSYNITARYSDGADVFVRTADLYRTSYEVELKLPGIIPSAHLLEDKDIALVMRRSGGRDPEYMRLEIREVNMMMSVMDKFTNVTAYGTMVT
jgi:hypothetical protein